MNKYNVFAKIEKFNDEQQIVEGYASTEALDSDGEIITIEALTDALSGYMDDPAVREMHQMIAAGVTKAAFVDEKGLYISAKIVDPIAWLKLKEGVYRYFSVGGIVLSKIGNRITKFLLTEISLVDRGANPEAKIEVIKMSKEKIEEIEKDIVIDNKEEVIEKSEKVESDVLTKFSDFMKDNNISVEDFASLFVAKKEKTEEVTEVVEKSEKPEVKPEVKEEVKTEVEVKEETIEKSFYSIQDLACVLSSLSYINDDVQWEAEYKNEDTELVNKIKDLLNTASEVLKEMIDKEVSVKVEKSESVDFLSGKFGIVKEDKETIEKSFKNDLEKTHKAVIEAKDTELALVKKELEEIKKSMTFDTKEEAETFKKEINQKRLDEHEKIAKSYNDKEKDLEEKIAKCASGSEKEALVKELRHVRFFKSNFL